MIDRIAPRFSRHEPLRHATALMAGMVSGLDRKNCWTIAEHRGDHTPDGLQHLLARAKWDAPSVSQSHFTEGVAPWLVGSASWVIVSTVSAGRVGVGAG